MRTIKSICLFSHFSPVPCSCMVRVSEPYSLTDAHILNTPDCMSGRGSRRSMTLSRLPASYPLISCTCQSVTEGSPHERPSALRCPEAVASTSLLAAAAGSSSLSSLLLAAGSQEAADPPSKNQMLLCLLRTNNLALLVGYLSSSHLTPFRSFESHELPSSTCISLYHASLS